MGYAPSRTPHEQAEPILRRMRTSYTLAVDDLKIRFSPEKELASNQASPMAPSALKSIAMVVRTNTDHPEFNRQKTWKWLNDNSEYADEWSISCFEEQFFDKAEIARWLLAVGITSKFPFDPAKQSAYKPQQSGSYDGTKTPHRTKLMDAVEEASAKFWGINARADEPDTHPTNAMVEKWLTEHLGVGVGMASKIATIVRPLWAHKGAPATPTK